MQYVFQLATKTMISQQEKMDISDITLQKKNLKDLGMVSGQVLIQLVILKVMLN